jgi:tetratricopeptide (TPR) repeat protein
MAPSPASADLAWELAAGTDLVLEVHLLPSGREETLRARVGLHFAASPPRRRPVAVRLGSKAIDIAAGESAFREQDRFVLPAAVDVLAVYPHAHYLCRSMLATATLPDGRRTTLLDIRSWDFDWQDQYRYREPIRLPAGTELRMEYVFDNSAANPRNRHDPPRRVVYGPGASDEMGDLWLQMVAVDEADGPRLTSALERRESESNVEGWRAALARTPDDAILRFNLGSELVLGSALEEGVAELERAIALDPGLARARTNLGNAFISRARGASPEAARQELERAVEQFELAASSGSEADAADAWFNLANTQAALGRFEEAHRGYDRALALRPGFLEARLNKAAAYAGENRVDEAVTEIERCLDASPGYVAALWNLAVLRGQEEAGAAAVLDRVERALAIEPESPSIRMLRADLLLHLERPADAEAAYRAVIEVDPRSADAWANLARALARLGRSGESAVAVARALVIDPRNAAALEVKRELAR